MLTAAQLDVLPQPIIAMYDEYMQSVINDIARRLAGMDFASSSAAWQMQRLTESGKVYETALEELAKLDGRSEELLREMFDRAGVKTLQFDDAIYRAVGLDPLPLNLSPAMAEVLRAGLEKTRGAMYNLTRTTATGSVESFVHAADIAYMQVSSGAFSYQEALRAGIKKLARNNLPLIGYASGRQDKLDVALRRTLLTGVSQTAGQLQMMRADQMGCDLVQTSAHIGARNTGVGPANHESWQGKIFSRSGTHKKYPDFVAETGYGTGAGLMGWNCRHSIFPFFEELSTEHYKAADLESYAKEEVSYKGERMSVYDATQTQRQLERNIRATKREIAALDAAGLDSTEERTQLYEDQREMRSFVRQTKLQRQRFREQAHELDKQPKALRPRQ